LLELTLIPWSNYNPFYAGWDRTDNQGAGGVSIHHPAGDVKKISTHNEVPINSTCVNQDYWLIDDWLQTDNGHGVTEGGSSGSPLFNDNHHVIGQLLGGCSGHNEDCDNPDNDWSNFGKIWASWNGNNASERLRDWLHPPNTNIANHDGIDVCNEGTQVNLNITHTITSSSSDLHQATNNITASNIVESGATATYEAENQIQLTDGFTAENGSDFIAKIEGFDCLLTCSRINLYSWTDNVCQGDDLCFNVLNADGYSITVDDGGTQIFQNSGNINSTSVCVWNTSGVSTGNYTVTVTFSENCNNTEISNTYQVSVNSCKKSTEVSSHDSSTQQVTSVSETTEEDFKVKVIPNPNDGNFTIDLLSQPSKPYLLELIDGRGSVLHHVEHLNATKINVEQSGLPVGTYFVRIQIGTKKVVKKVIIQ